MRLLYYYITRKISAAAQAAAQSVATRYTIEVPQSTVSVAKDGARAMGRSARGVCSDCFLATRGFAKDGAHATEGSVRDARSDCFLATRGFAKDGAHAREGACATPAAIVEQNK